jgi:hypothetical protein
MQEEDYSKGRNCVFESEYGPLHEIGRLQPSPCSVADVEYFNLLLFLEDAIYYAINMRLAAIEQVPQFILLTR